MINEVSKHVRRDSLGLQRMVTQSVYRVDFQRKKTIEEKVDLYKFDPEKIEQIREKFKKDLEINEINNCDHQHQLLDNRRNLSIQNFVSKSQPNQTFKQETYLSGTTEYRNRKMKNMNIRRRLKLGFYNILGIKRISSSVQVTSNDKSDSLCSENISRDEIESKDQEISNFKYGNQQKQINRPQSLNNHQKQIENSHEIDEQDGNNLSVKQLLEVDEQNKLHTTANGHENGNASLKQERVLKEHDNMAKILQAENAKGNGISENQQSVTQTIGQNAVNLRYDKAHPRKPKAKMSRESSHDEILSLTVGKQPVVTKSQIQDTGNSSSSETTESDDQAGEQVEQRNEKVRRYNTKRGFQLARNATILMDRDKRDGIDFVNLEARSLFCFTNKNRFRLWCLGLQTTLFEHMILAVIILNSVCLAIYDYSEQNLQYNRILNYIMMFFTLVFLFEVTTKIVAYGFFIDKKSFIWQGPFQNTLDLIIVVGGLIEIINIFMPTNLGEYSGLFKVFRVFRTIRPLASIQRMPQIVIIVQSFKKIKDELCQVMFVLITVIMIFAIFCLHTFSGQVFYRCRMTQYPIMKGDQYVWELFVSDEYEDGKICRPGSIDPVSKCPNETYCGSPFQKDFGISLNADEVFDSELLQYGHGTGFINMPDSFLAVLQHFTIDNWTIVLSNLIDSSDQATWIICIIMVIFGNFFIMNLILAVVYHSFDDIIERNTNQKAFTNNYLSAHNVDEHKPLAEQLTKQISTQKQQLRKVCCLSLPWKGTHEEQTSQSQVNQVMPVKFEGKDSKRSNNMDNGKQVSVKTRLKRSKSIEVVSSYPKIEIQHNLKHQLVKNEMDQFLLEFECEDTPLIRKIQLAAKYKVLDDKELVECLQKFIDVINQDIVCDDQKKSISKFLVNRDNLSEGELIKCIKLLQTFQQNATNKFKQEFYKPDQNQMNPNDSGTHHHHHHKAQHGGDLYESKLQKRINELRSNNCFGSQCEDSEDGHSSHIHCSGQQLDHIHQSLVIRTRLFILNNFIDTDGSEFMIFLIIMINSIVIMFEKYPSDDEYEERLDMINFIFYWIYVAEMIIKIVAMGPKIYVSSLLNIFDAMIILLSTFVWITEQVFNQISVGNPGLTALRTARILRTFRALRALRIIRMARQFEKLHKFFQLMIKTIQDIGQITILLFIVIIMYALIGMEIFAYGISLDENDQVVDIRMANNTIRMGMDVTVPDSNFNNFIEALTSVFIVIANENWTVVFISHLRAFNPFLTSVYFLSLLFVGQWLIFNLFIAQLTIRFQIWKQQELEIDKDHNKLKKLKTLYPNAYIEDSESSAIGPQDKNVVSRLFKRYFNRFMNLFTRRHLSPSKSQKIKKSGKFSKTQTFRKENNNLAEIQKSMSLHKNSKVLHGNSLFCISEDNECRQFFHNLFSSNKWQYSMLNLIVVSCIMLFMDKPLETAKCDKQLIFFITDSTISILFMAEAVLLIFVHGFWNKQGQGYFQNYFNILDFVIAVLSVLAPYYDSLRFAKVLKPLRFINKVQSIQVLLMVFWESNKKLFKILCITLIFLLIFSIIFVNVLKGYFWHCQLTPFQQHISGDLWFSKNEIKVVTKYDCINNGGMWIRDDDHFDNVPSAMLTLIRMSLEGWTDEMYVSQKIEDIGYAHDDKTPYNQSLGQAFIALAFMFYMLFFYFFILNLYQSLVFVTYKNQHDFVNMDYILTEEQRKWLQTKMLILQIRPGYFNAKPKKHQLFRRSLYNFLHYKGRNHRNSHAMPWFDIFIFFCILINFIVLALPNLQYSQEYNDYLEYINIVLLGIFIIELVLKLLVYQKSFFREFQNQFDFGIVVGSVVSVGLKYLLEEDNLGTSALIVRTFRIFNVMRIIQYRQFKFLNSLKILLQTFIISIPAMLNVTSLLVLFFYIYSVLGVQLFYDIKLNYPLDSKFNFQTIGSSMLTLMRVSTGENWQQIMHAVSRSYSPLYQCDKHFHLQAFNQTCTESDHKKEPLEIEPNGCGNPVIGITFFVVFQTLIVLIFLKLFVAIILQSFLEIQQKDSNIISLDKQDIFRDIWSKYDRNAKGTIPDNHFRAFMFKLGKEDKSMGWDPADKDNELLISNNMKQLGLITFKFGEKSYYEFYNVLEQIAWNIISKGKNDTYQNSLLHNDEVRRKKKELMKAEQGQSALAEKVKNMQVEHMLIKMSKFYQKNIQVFKLKTDSEIKKVLKVQSSHDSENSDHSEDNSCYMSHTMTQQRSESLKNSVNNVMQTYGVKSQRRSTKLKNKKASIQNQDVMEFFDEHQKRNSIQELEYQVNQLTDNNDEEGQRTGSLKSNQKQPSAEKPDLEQESDEEYEKLDTIKEQVGEESDSEGDHEYKMKSLKHINVREDDLNKEGKFLQDSDNDWQSDISRSDRSSDSSVFQFDYQRDFEMTKKQVVFEFEQKMKQADNHNQRAQSNQRANDLKYPMNQFKQQRRARSPQGLGGLFTKVDDPDDPFGNKFRQYKGQKKFISKK